MKDHFTALGFSPTLVLESEPIEFAWRKATRSHAEQTETENSPSDSALAKFHEARAVLSDPVKRLAHWLALHDVSPTRSTSMDPGMMDLFGSLEGALSNTDNLLSRHAAATTTLAKALLTKEAIEVQLDLQSQMQKVLARKQEALARFPGLEDKAAQNDFEEAIATLQELQFLTKWEAQCQERLLSLLDC